MTLTDTTTLGQSGLGSNGPEGVFHTTHKWILTVGCNFLSNLENTYFRGDITVSIF